MSAQLKRKLTTILAADAAGYSRFMEADETGAMRALQAARAVFSRLIERHDGRIANTAGDGLIAEFPSVVEAVNAALEIQTELVDRPGEAKGLSFRIGIHLGDVLVDGDDLLGEGVNLAARLQSMAAPGHVLISQPVYDQVRRKLPVAFTCLGERRPKNYESEVTVYDVARADAKAPGRHRRRWPGIARPAAAPVEPGRIAHEGRAIGLVCGGLILLNLLTGDTLWAQFPVLLLVTLYGLRAGPHLAGDRAHPITVRIGVLMAALVALNLLTWGGFFWAIWPVAALALVEAARRLRIRRA